MEHFRPFALAICLTSLVAHAEEFDGRLPAPPADAPAVDFVNPFIGSITDSKKLKSSSRGKTFPGAATPYGLVQLSPDTISGGDKATNEIDVLKNKLLSLRDTKPRSVVFGIRRGARTQFLEIEPRW